MITIKVILKKTEKPLKYGYEHVFHGYISDLLGNNTYGTHKSKYSYSNICGGIPKEEGLVFSGNPYFIIRTNDEETWQNFLSNISKKVNVMENMIIEGFSVDDTNTEKKIFRTLPSSPILVSKKYDKYNHLGPEELLSCEKYLINSVLVKAKECGFSVDPNLSIRIKEQKNHVNVRYRDIFNKGRNFLFEINSNNETKEFILTHGLGRSCGCGFGVIV